MLVQANFIKIVELMQQPLNLSKLHRVSLHCKVLGGDLGLQGFVLVGHGECRKSGPK